MNRSTTNPVADPSSIETMLEVTPTLTTLGTPLDTPLETDIAAWLRDEVLAQIAYQGTPDQLRTVLERHDRAAEQLTRILELGESVSVRPGLTASGRPSNPRE